MRKYRGWAIIIGLIMSGAPYSQPYAEPNQGNVKADKPSVPVNNVSGIELSVQQLKCINGAVTALGEASDPFTAEPRSKIIVKLSDGRIIVSLREVHRPPDIMRHYIPPSGGGGVFTCNNNGDVIKFQFEK